MRPSRFDYIMLILLLILMLVMQLSSCTTIRRTSPTVDDVSGAPIPHHIHQNIKQ